MSLRIAITRAMPEAEESAARIRALGGEALIAPLLRIVPRAHDADAAGAQALIFTSVNGARAFAGEAPDTPALAVGDATAEALRARGFRDVRSADGNGPALAALAIETLAPAAGKLIYIRGAHAAFDLASALEAAGFAVDARIAYAAEQAKALPPALAAPLDVVLFYSARAASAYRALGAPQTGQRIAACMSQGVAEALGPGWNPGIVSARQRADPLLRDVCGN